MVRATRRIQAPLGDLFNRAASHQANLLLGAVFWTVVAATALARRALGARTSCPESARAYWSTRPERGRPDDLTRQY